MVSNRPYEIVVAVKGDLNRCSDGWWRVTVWQKMGRSCNRGNTVNTRQIKQQMYRKHMIRSRQMCWHSEKSLWSNMWSSDVLWSIIMTGQYQNEVMYSGGPDLEALYWIGSFELALQTKCKSRTKPRPCKRFDIFCLGSKSYQVTTDQIWMRNRWINKSIRSSESGSPHQHAEPMLAGTLEGFLGSIEPETLAFTSCNPCRFRDWNPSRKPIKSYAIIHAKNSRESRALTLLWLHLAPNVWRTVPFFGLIFWQKSPMRHTLLKPSLFATLFNSYPLPLLHQFTHWLHISSWLGCPTWWISAAQVVPTAPQMIGGHDACSTGVVVLLCPVDHMANPAWNSRCQGSRP